MAFPQSRLQRGYVQKENTWGQIPNSGGTATVGNSDAFLFTDLDMNYNQAINQRPDKTGSLGQVVGTPGRKVANWRMRCSAAGSGTPGSEPDCGPFIEAALGKAIASGVYEPDDTNISLAIYDFNALATASQRVISGAICNSMTIDAGGDFMFLEFSGQGKHVVDTDVFSSLDVTGRSGLNSFPSEPGTPTTNGTSVAGYKGIVTLDGNVYTTLRTFRAAINVARAVDEQVWDDDYPGFPSAGLRTVTTDISMRDDDSANFKALKGKAHNKVPVNLQFQIGKTSGNIWTVLLRNVLLGTPQYDNSGNERIVSFSQSIAHMSTLIAKDEFRLTMS